MMLSKTILLIAVSLGTLYVGERERDMDTNPCVTNSYYPALYFRDDSKPTSTLNEYLIHYYLPASASSTFLASSSKTSLLSSVVVVEKGLDMFYSSSQMEASLPQCSYTI